MRSSLLQRTCGRTSRVTCKASFAGKSASPMTSRRTALAGLIGAPSILLGQGAALANTPITFQNHMRAKDFMDSIDEARNDREDYRRRFSYAKNLDPKQLKARIIEARDRIAGLGQFIDKSMFNRADQEIGQAGAIRYDFDRLVANLADSSAKKRAKQLQLESLKALEQVDYYVSSKDKDMANLWKERAVSALDKAISALG